MICSEAMHVNRDNPPFPAVPHKMRPAAPRSYACVQTHRQATLDAVTRRDSKKATHNPFL